MSWLKKGSELQSKDFLSSGTTKSYPDFWLKPGKENARKIIFIDDPDAGFGSHTIKIGENYETLTCLGDECPMCVAGYYRVPTFVFTILDCTPWTDNKGVDHQYYKKILRIRGRSMKEIIDARRDANDGTLKGVKMTVMRTGDKEPSSGDDYQVTGRIDLSKLQLEKPEDGKPFDYLSLFEPLSIAKIEAKLKYAAPPQKANKKKNTTPRSALSSFGDDDSQQPQFDESEAMPF